MTDTGHAPELPARVLVVDDEDTVRKLLVRLLSRGGHQADAAGSAEEAIAKLRAERFDVVLSDMNMPGASGLELIRHIHTSHRDVATVMVTAVDDAELAEAALEQGSYGYVIKPFEPNEILIGVSNALRRRALEIENRAHREHLERLVRERTAELWNAVQGLERAQGELRTSRADTIERLSIAAEFRDNETGHHIKRMSRYCMLIAQNLGHAHDDIEILRLASVMHDVGKIGIPDRILLKPGRLTAAEFEEMKKHAEFGHRILSGTGSDLLDLAASVALTHHERFDGSGYPNGLAGDAIPQEGRIAAVADVFDALTTNRLYRKAFTLTEAVSIMTKGRGTDFDPEILDIFLDNIDVALRIKDEAEAA